MFLAETSAATTILVAQNIVFGIVLGGKYFFFQSGKYFFLQFSFSTLKFCLAEGF